MAIPSRGYGFEPQTSVEHTRFKSEYFSGTNTRIYFGDLWMDEITSFDFTLQEQVAPIFGYASFTFDRVARGSRQIQGTFRINFRESGYLNVVMQHLSQRKRKSTNPYHQAFEAEQWKKGLTADHLVNDKSNFEALAEEFESSLWGEGNNDSVKKAANRKDKETHFYPKYAEYDAKSGGVTHDDEISQRELAEDGFSIMIGYGPVNEDGSQKATDAAHTLTGVHLTGVRQVIQGDGMPIEEEYSFIAKDLDANIARGKSATKKKTAPTKRDPAKEVPGYRPIQN